MRHINTRLRGDDLRDMFASAIVLLKQQVPMINALNVFPVPDGDTGTNMYLTVREVVESSSSIEDASAGEMANSMARAALMGARGNSGVILSQFFKGISLGLESKVDFGAYELADAFKHARVQAYTAIDRPVEGTILTVMDRIAKVSASSLVPGITVLDLLDKVCVAARDAVESTPNMLSVLKDAGVVDAGAQGLSVILEGLRRHLGGESLEDDVEVLVSDALKTKSYVVSQDFLSETKENVYGYCTQFLINGTGLDITSIRKSMGVLANSTVVVGDEAMVNVHVHTEDPGQILSLGTDIGTLNNIKIANMDEQRDHFATEDGVEVLDKMESETLGIIAVALGEGITAMFVELGASHIIKGGNTMNPSVKDLLDVLEAASFDNLLLLPNNKNILSAAIQAADSSTKNVKVVSTKSIPQGIAAILSFKPEDDIDVNFEKMLDSVDSVRSGEVTIAVRSINVDGVDVEQGQFIGLLENELVKASDSISAVVLGLLDKCDVFEGSLITLYRGADLSEEEALNVEQEVVGRFAMAEVELVYGGQPNYHFIVSAE